MCEVDLIKSKKSESVCLGAPTSQHDNTRAALIYAKLVFDPTNLARYLPEVSQ